LPSVATSPGEPYVTTGVVILSEADTAPAVKSTPMPVMPSAPPSQPKTPAPSQTKAATPAAAPSQTAPSGAAAFLSPATLKAAIEKTCGPSARSIQVVL